jgi:hypothetical protein
MFQPIRFPRLLAAAAICAAASSCVLPSPLLAQAPASKREVKRVDLRPQFEQWGLSIKYQHRRDTCAVFTVAGALEFALAKVNGEGQGLGEEYLNWAANEAGGQYFDGATFSELERGFGKWGVCDERAMPYGEVFNPLTQPSAEAVQSARQIWAQNFRWNWIERGRREGLTDAHLARVKAVLRRGLPVAGGGEHCMLIVGFDDARGFLRVRNHATRKNETLPYAEAKRKFVALLWIDLPGEGAAQQ